MKIDLTATSTLLIDLIDKDKYNKALSLRDDKSFEIIIQNRSSVDVYIETIDNEATSDSYILYNGNEFVIKYKLLESIKMATTSGTASLNLLFV